MSDKPANIDLLDDEPTPNSRGLSLTSILLIVVVLVAAVVVGLALSRQNLTQPTDGVAPEFSVTTFDGETMQLADLRGKVVVVNFWASWCIPCKDEAPVLEAMWNEYRSRDVVFLGVAYVDAEPSSRAFIDEYGLTYPNAPDIGTRISDAYHIQGVPETFIIDQNGNIAQFIYAGVTEDGLRQALDPLLEAA